MRYGCHSSGGGSVIRSEDFVKLIPKMVSI